MAETFDKDYVDEVFKRLEEWEIAGLPWLAYVEDKLSTEILNMDIPVVEPSDVDAYSNECIYRELWLSDDHYVHQSKNKDGKWGPPINGEPTTDPNIIEAYLHTAWMIGREMEMEASISGDK
jgi:hypothetical protein